MFEPLYRHFAVPAMTIAVVYTANAHTRYDPTDEDHL